MWPFAPLAWWLAHGAFAQITTHVGVLHSLSGTMAISDCMLKDTILMEIEAINKKGDLADQYIVMERGEIVMQGLGKDMEADGVRQRMSI